MLTEKIMDTANSCADYTEIAASCLMRSSDYKGPEELRLYIAYLVACMVAMTLIDKWECGPDSEALNLHMLDATKSLKESCEKILNDHKGEKNGGKASKIV